MCNNYYYRNFRWKNTYYQIVLTCLDSVNTAMNCNHKYLNPIIYEWIEAKSAHCLPVEAVVVILVWAGEEVPL